MLHRAAAMLLLAGAARGLRPTMRRVTMQRMTMRRMTTRRMTTRLLATSTGADALPALRNDLAAIRDEVAKTRPPAERVAAWQNDIRDLEAAAAAPDFWDDSDKAQSALARGSSVCVTSTLPNLLPVHCAGRIGIILLPPPW